MPLRILQLVGSPTNTLYADLSALYARGSIDALADEAKYTFLIAHLSPDGAWRFPDSLSAGEIDKVAPVSLASAIATIAELRIDLAIPQMFCVRGMTDMRALLGVLNIPYLGNLPLQMGIAADKAMAKAIVAAAGVSVPHSQILQRGDIAKFLQLAHTSESHGVTRNAKHLVFDDDPELGGLGGGAQLGDKPDVRSLGNFVLTSVPTVVKPNAADNSEGVSLVTETAQYPAALQLASTYSDDVLIERYIELGREVRCGVVEHQGELRCLPLEEYYVDKHQRPIRMAADKLKRGADGDLRLVAKTRTESWIVAGDDPIVPAVHEAARRCFRALGSRQYNLFDFRVDPGGRPWFLESGPYCSFAPASVIVTMMEAAGTPLRDFFAQAVASVLHDHSLRISPSNSVPPE